MDSIDWAEVDRKLARAKEMPRKIGRSWMWSGEETRILHRVLDMDVTAAAAYRAGVLPERSLTAIENKMIRVRIEREAAVGDLPDGRDGETSSTQES